MPKTQSHPIDVHVGSRIKMIRKMNSLSQEKLGDAIGVTFQQVQKYEKGTNRVGASRLQQIATVLGVDVGVFFADAPTTDQSAGSSSTFDLFKTSEGVRIAPGRRQDTGPDRPSKAGRIGGSDRGSSRRRRGRIASIYRVES